MSGYFINMMHVRHTSCAVLSGLLGRKSLNLYTKSPFVYTYGLQFPDRVSPKKLAMRNRKVSAFATDPGHQGEQQSSF